MTDFPADSILVVLEATPTGELASSAAGLLAAAAQIGTPVALAVTAPGQAQSLAELAAALGAERVLAVETTSTQSELTIPYVDALAAAAARIAPEAVLISNSTDGRD
ncbi:MAG TPA: electron transfer flavoprotein subunit alpha/FixB family protein, partial [Agromyces mariniharenae]|nr:electron transfer flavoprotein subunit alpha/FixB family protein [Agromyces mariniharenae]